MERRRFPEDLGDSDFCRRLWDEMANSATKSARALAEAIGVNHGQPNEWLAGTVDPSGANLAALADHFDCSMDFLWGRVNDRDAYYSGDPTGAVQAIRSAMETLRAAERLARGPGQ